MKVREMCEMVLRGIRRRTWREKKLDDAGILAWANARGSPLYESIIGILEQYEQDSNLQARLLSNTDRQTWIAMGAAQAAKELSKGLEDTAKEMEKRVQGGEGG